MSKLKIQLHEFNVVCGAYRYLPYSTGLLRAYAETDPLIREAYEFLPFQYEMDTERGVWDKYTDTPDVAAFSVAMWNEQLNLTIAKGLKQTYGDRILIVFGGCHVPHHPKEYMEKYPFIDVCVRGDGEEAFRDILVRRTDKSFRDMEGIIDVTWRVGDSINENPGKRPFEKDLDKFPSPYAAGLFDELVQNRKGGKNGWQAILESNRGCPF